MSFEYKNPTSGVILTGPVSVERTSTFGDSFSVNAIGGYMEVYTLENLNWTIPNTYLAPGGLIEFSGNSIPISFVYGGSDGGLPITNQLNLFNDGIV